MRDFHIGGYVGEHGRLEKLASPGMTFTAGDHTRTFG